MNLGKIMHGVRVGAAVLITMIYGCGECEVDYDCPATQVCNVQNQQCEIFVCREDAHCQPAQRCRENRCVSSAPRAPIAAAAESVGE